MTQSQSSTGPELYSSAQFAIELDGDKSLTSLRSIDGGHAKTEILTYHSGTKNLGVLRQNGKRKYEDIKLVMGMAAGPAMWNWMNSFIAGTCERRNGALVAADKNYVEKARRLFKEAIISSIDFPSFNSTDKNPATVTVTVSPETMVYTVGDGGNIAAPDPDGGPTGENQRQKHVSACNFHFSYHGASDGAMKRVTKVDAFSVKTKIVEYHHAGRHEPIKLAGKVEWPNIAFYLPEIEAQFFIDLHTKTMSGQPAPIGAAELSYFDNNRRPRGVVEFEGCRIFSVAPDKHDATNEEVRQVKVEMAVESITVKPKGS
ncbi:MAG: phage tail protein [Kofleriaceae bacterium]